MKRKYMKFLTIIILFILFIGTQKVYAMGPLDEFNVNMVIESDGKVDLQGQFTANGAENDTNFGDWAIGSVGKVIFAGFGIATLTMVLIAIIQFIRLGGASGNPQERGQAVKAIGHLGIAIMLLGGITLIVGISINLLK